MNINIEEALQLFRTGTPRVARTERYYRGEHDLAFASEKFQNTFGTLFREFALNLCPAICDAIKDKLKVTGFRVESAVENGTGDISADVASIWQRNRMASRSDEVHKEALKNGDSYVIVWPGADRNAALFPNAAADVLVVYDDEDVSRILWAAKRWRTRTSYLRLNLFYPDRIEKYISTRPSESFLPDPKEMVPITDGPSIVPNPYGVVPVFHFANNADIGTLGRSELEPAIPIQDGLNKSVLDMLVAMEFSAYRQRWAAGIEIEYDSEGRPAAPFTAGIDHLWISENPNTRFGDFDTASLEQFLKVKDSFRIDMASVTGTPLYYLMPQTGGFPSGESLRKAETRFIAKVRDRQQGFGQVWADVMQFAARVEGIGNIQLSAAWEDPSPLTERELLENILLRKQVGISQEQALREAGYGAVDISEMSEKR
ncbi:MAG: phage portal protein [Acidobacteriota bacterium]